MTHPPSYVPALRYGLLTRLYDPVVALTTRERTFKKRLVEQAGIRAGHEVLDLGCGTGTLALLIHELQLGAVVTGVDGDPTILAIARRKARLRGSAARFEQAMAQDLPFACESFDRVVSSLFFHHLSPRAKRLVAEEVLRVLKPGGELHVADWGRATDLLMRGAFLPVQLLDGFENTRDHVEGRFPEALREAGFGPVSERGSLRTIVGTLGFFEARRT